MSTYLIRLKLLSDTTFGRGDGVSGLVDSEVQHDADGLPYLGGRTLKGLLRNECIKIMGALRSEGLHQCFEPSASRLFGSPGTTEDPSSIMHVGNAHLPEDLCRAVHKDVRRGTLKPWEVLDSLTTIRRQTAIDPVSGAPQENTLRSIRVIIRGLPFTAQVSFAVAPSVRDLALLAACVKALRRVGEGRNRGQGLVECRLLDGAVVDCTDHYFAEFRRAMTGC